MVGRGGIAQRTVDPGVAMVWKRNLLIVLAHGLRSDALDDSQCWPLHTPNIRQITKRGVRLSATSACPADAGGMVSLLTGLHTRQHGHVQQGQLTPSDMGAEGGGWPAILADSDYHLAGVGCVQAIEPWLDEAVSVSNVDSIEPVDCAYMAAMQQKGFEGAIQKQRIQRQRVGPFDPKRLLLDSQDDVDGFIAAKGCQAVSQMPRDKPWALIVVFSGPANDLPPPTLFETIVDAEALEEGYRPVDFLQVDSLAELDYPRTLLQHLNRRRLGQVRADYLGRVSLIDYGVGRMATSMRERADADRSWLLLGSDRGQLLGEHGVVGHRSFLSGAIRVPIIIAPPKPVSQKVYPELLSTTDFAATVAALGACDASAASVGRSLLPVLANHAVETQGQLPGCISEFGGRLMHESERYKVVFDTETLQPISLFDRLRDPGEQDNLVDTPIALNTVDSLRGRLGEALLPLRATMGVRV